MNLEPHEFRWSSDWTWRYNKGRSDFRRVVLYVDAHVHVRVHLVGQYWRWCWCCVHGYNMLQLCQPRLSELQGKSRVVSRLPCTNWNPDLFGVTYLDPCLGISYIFQGLLRIVCNGKSRFKSYHWGWTSPKPQTNECEEPESLGSYILRPCKWPWYNFSDGFYRLIS